MPNLMPAITALIMQITTHLSQPNGNPQLALTFQPLVNMALNMQLQAWQQASSSAHSLPLSVMEQMHLAMAPHQAAAGAVGMESNLASALAQHTSDALAVALPHSQALQEGIVHQLQAQPVDSVAAELSAQQQQQEQAQQAVADAQAAHNANQKVLATEEGTDDAAPAYTAKYQAEEAPEEVGEEGEEEEQEGGEDVLGDEEYNVKVERSGRRGQGPPGSRAHAHRAQRARKRSKLLEEYLTDEEGGEDGRQAKRRAHLD